MMRIMASNLIHLCLTALLCTGTSALAQATSKDVPLEKIVVSAPGPHNISYLPVFLIPAIGADRDEGVQLQILPVGGGSVALKNLVTRNADFAVAGFPAAMSLHTNGGDVVGILTVSDAPLLVLMVRSALKGKVKRIADLRGKVVGVNTSTKSSKTASQQMAELLLKSDGVDLDMVRIVPSGQNWLAQSSLILTGTADAVMGDEPFASRLSKDGKVFFLAHTGDPRTTRKIPGANFLHATLETRSDVIRDSPEKVAKMTRMMKKSLQWIATHSPEQVADKLNITDPEERSAMVQALRNYPRAFSRDGKFSKRQLKDTELFFHKSSEGDAGAQALRIDTLINTQWAGSKP